MMALVRVCSDSDSLRLPQLGGSQCLQRLGARPTHQFGAIPPMDLPIVSHCFSFTMIWFRLFTLRIKGLRVVCNYSFSFGSNKHCKSKCQLGPRFYLKTVTMLKDFSNVIKMHVSWVL